VFYIYFAELFRFTARPRPVSPFAEEVRHLFIESKSVDNPVVRQHSCHKKQKVPPLEAATTDVLKQSIIIVLKRRQGFL
jgi:hypothetical protein